MVNGNGSGDDKIQFELTGRARAVAELVNRILWGAGIGAALLLARELAVTPANSAEVAGLQKQVGEIRSSIDAIKLDMQTVKTDMSNMRELLGETRKDVKDLTQRK